MNEMSMNELIVKYKVAIDVTIYKVTESCNYTESCQLYQFYSSQQVRELYPLVIY